MSYISNFIHFYFNAMLSKSSLLWSEKCEGEGGGNETKIIQPDKVIYYV